VKLLKSEVNSISVPGILSEFQLLNNHLLIVSVLVNRTIMFKGDTLVIEDELQDKFSKGNEQYILTIDSGTIEMKDNYINRLIITPFKF